MDIMSPLYQLISSGIFLLCIGAFVWCYIDAHRAEKTYISEEAEVTELEQSWTPNYNYRKSEIQIRVCSYTSNK